MTEGADDKVVRANEVARQVGHGPMSGANGVLFTAFEPSGDDHASAVIAELRSRRPEIPIYAWGGPKMAAAGAVVIERTGDDAVMGVPGIGKIVEHQRINARVARWLDTTGKPGTSGSGGGGGVGSSGGKGLIGLHVPVDSPAANFPICKITKRRGIRVMHLVAPQMWAWGSWRVKKLRRLSDRVLCVLPFEEDWFMSRGVSARFVGHPLFDHPVDTAGLDLRAAQIDAGFASIARGTQGKTNGAMHAPTGTAAAVVKVALMPGSRPSELSLCFPILLDAFNRLRRDFPNTRGVVAATKPAVAVSLRERAAQLGGWPAGLEVVSGDTDGVVRWCDCALVVSGTVTLQIAKQHKPMVAVYRPKWLFYQLLGRWLVSTRYFTLPNLIAGKKILQEFIPHFGDGEDLAVEVIRLLRQPGYAEDQRRELAKVCERFKEHVAAREAVDEIEKMIG